MNRQIQL